MADLNKALSQIVSSLTDLISKINSSSVQPKTSNVRKAADMTYHEFLGRALAGKEPIAVHSKNAAYALQEDLHLLYELAQAENISIKTFEAVSKEKKVFRSPESLQKRYY